MSRKIVENPEFIAGGSWLKFEEVQTAAGPREFVRRRNGQYQAVKVLPIFIPSGADIYRDKDETIAYSMKSYGLEKFFVFILSADRPITYFETPGISLTENYVYELPGGLVRKDEYIADASVRELFAETGLVYDDTRVLGVECLVQSCPYDSGSHVEWQSIYIVLFQGTPAPHASEGIIPAKCLNLPLLQAETILKQHLHEGVAVEGYVFSALNALCAQLYGGWNNFSSPYKI